MNPYGAQQPPQAGAAYAGAQAGAMQPMGAFGGGPLALAGGAPPGAHGPKGQVRNGMMVLLFGIISCGIYQLLWFIWSCNEIAAFLQRDEPSWLKVVGLSIVTCGIYGLIWQITRVGALIQECQQRAGVPNAQNHGWMYIIPYYNVILMTEELNKAWQGPA
jgi:hypothetical protein